MPVKLSWVSEEQTTAYQFSVVNKKEAFNSLATLLFALSVRNIS